MDMIEGMDKVRGTHTSMGFVPYLERNGVAMPIQIEAIGAHSMGKLPKPRIYGSKSVWALPGGGSYISHDPVSIYV
jgi:hypothetical protein